MYQESLFLSHQEHKLHIRHIWQRHGGIPILMLHGAIENGRIFYSDKGKGFGCYLARQGFDVYVADYRGRGLSTPTIKQNNNHGYYETITQDIPELMNFIFQKTGKKMHVVCHSWGGVLFGSSLVRFPEVKEKTLSNLCFGTKRQVTVWNPERLLKVTLVWNRLAPLLTRRKGFLDAKRLKIGADAETHRSLTESVSWVKRSKWVDPVDNFDYEHAAKRVVWPPTWHLTGINDHVLGNERDVKRFISESHNNKAKFTLLSKANGNKHDYDHINILTHANAVHDHFPNIVSWLKSHYEEL